MELPASWLFSFAIPVFWPLLRFIMAVALDGLIPISKRAVWGYGAVVLVTLVALLIVRVSGAGFRASTVLVPSIWVAFVAAIGNDAWALLSHRRAVAAANR